MHATQTTPINYFFVSIPTLYSPLLYLLPTTTKMMRSSATTRDREDESLPLPTATGHHGRRHKNEFQYHKFFPFVGRPFTSLRLRSILTVGGLILLVFPLVLNLSTGESLLYQSQGHSEGKFFFISCLLTTDTSCSKFP